LIFAAGCGATPRGDLKTGKPPYRVVAQDGPGAVFLSGGATDPPALLAKFRDLAGGPGAPIVVVPFAMGPGSGEPFKAAFEALGVDDVAVLPTERGQEAEGRAMLARAGGIYVLGGLTGVLTARMAPFKDAVQRAWRGGAAVGGHSAGAMIVADDVIISGEGPAALAHGLDADRGGMELGKGVGLLPGVLVDTHFSERARFSRLWVAAGATGHLGIGVDPNTAALLTPDGKVTAFGTGAVTLIRPEGAAGAPARVQVLGPSDSAALADWKPE
jgi:cyanophycinase